MWSSQTESSDPQDWCLVFAELAYFVGCLSGVISGLREFPLHPCSDTYFRVCLQGLGTCLLHFCIVEWIEQRKLALSDGSAHCCQCSPAQVQGHLQANCCSSLHTTSPAPVLCCRLLISVSLRNLWGSPLWFMFLFSILAVPWSCLVLCSFILTVPLPGNTIACPLSKPSVPANYHNGIHITMCLCVKSACTP